MASGTARETTISRRWRRGWISANRWLLVAAVALGAVTCGDDGTEADRIGVGAACTAMTPCREGQTCLPFKGGYCGLSGCRLDNECPAGSACVLHSDATSYCFRTCLTKEECNVNRTPAVESNCSANVTFMERNTSEKACVPPSS